MPLKQIPCYYYQNSVQKDTANINLRIDGEFAKKYSSATSETQLYSWSGVHEASLKNMINGFLNYALIIDDNPFYIGIDNGQVFPETAQAGMNLTKTNVKFVTNVTRSDYSTFFPNVEVKTLNNCTTGNSHLGYTNIINPQQTPTYGVSYLYAPNIDYGQFYNQNVEGKHLFTFVFWVYDDDLFVDKACNNNCDGACFTITGHTNADVTEIIDATLSVQYFARAGGVLNAEYGNALNLNGAQDKDKDVDNPYPDDGGEGGDGQDGDPTGTDPVEVPELPSVGASDFITIYGPSASTLSSLAQFLWSADSIFDINNFKKLYTDPSEALIGLNVCPCVPSSSGTKHIMFGNIDTEIGCTYYTSQWCKVQCGTVAVKTTANCFMDYSPYVKVQIFLPYIGFQMLDADEVMGRNISITYHVDIVSGDLVAFLSVSGRGVLYSYSGNCLCTIPITGSSYGQFWNKYYSSLANVVPAMGGGAMSGGAAGAAMGGLNTLFNTAETVMLDQKPQYQKSGTMSGAAGIMGVQKPFIVIERPNISVPEYVYKYAGLSANKTMSLGSCKGFTQVDYVHLDGIDATTEEIQEIESLLHKGVIL